MFINKYTYINTSADPEGRTWGPDPSWDLLEVGSCVEVWGIGEGSKGCFQLIINIFCIIQTYYIYTYIVVPSSILSMEWFVLSLYSPYPNYYYEKNPTSHPLHSWKGIFIFFLSRITRFYTILRQKMSRGGPPDPPLPPHGHIYNIKLPCHLYVSVEKRFQLY